MGFRTRRWGPRGTIYTFGRGRWHHYKRHHRFRRHYRRRYRIRHRARRYRKAFRRAFHDPHPRSYLPRRPIPSNILTVRFQGVILIPETIMTNTKVLSPRVARVDTRLDYFLQAVLPRDDTSKVGGPCDDSTLSPRSDPGQWWRWAYMAMQPKVGTRQLYTTSIMTLEEMVSMFGSYAVYRHVKTKYSVMCTDNFGNGWSPVASLLTQDNYAEEADPRIRFPSFAHLTSLGAPWCFPPVQRSVGHGSFNKHTVRGTNDPQGEIWKWLRRDWGSITDQKPTSSGTTAPSG
uniref:Capsid protein n=1 Tax=Grey teal gyrovirus TaxID=2798291 RepID=A0A7T4V8I0_9VIRU|nr:VP1 [Grey teal gyrovirus]